MLLESEESQTEKLIRLQEEGEVGPSWTGVDLEVELKEISVK
jgi:hypothetical protein